jgi:hypothetical protein
VADLHELLQSLLLISETLYKAVVTDGKLMFVLFQLLRIEIPLEDADILFDADLMEQLVLFADIIFTGTYSVSTNLHTCPNVASRYTQIITVTLVRGTHNLLTRNGCRIATYLS